MGFITEFKEFVSRGKVVDLAIGVIIGGAFQKIISSLVSDVIMPPLSVLIGGVDVKDYKFVIKEAVINIKGNISLQPVTINIGTFIQAVIDFLIISLAIFLAIKAINRFKKKEEQKVHALSGEEKLLTEIRDLLKQK